MRAFYSSKNGGGVKIILFFFVLGLVGAGVFLAPLKISDFFSGYFPKENQVQAQEYKGLEKLKIKKVNFTTYAFETLDGNIIEIGVKEHSSPIPYVKLNKWDGEASVSLSFPTEAQENLQLEGNKVKWVEDKLEAHIYPLEPEVVTERDEKGKEHTSKINENGGLEFEIILKEKPDSNVLTFNIETQGLKFYYQPELTQEEKDQGAFRPENVVGSYAVYHESKSGDYTALGGKNYMTGKAFHIYRPKIIDNAGNWVWGVLNIDKEAGILSVEIPQEFLDNAVYPIRHAAGLTFGWTSKGSSRATFPIRGLCAKATPSFGGTATKITPFLSGWDVDAQCALYLGVNLQTPATETKLDMELNPSGFEAEVDFNFTNGPTVTANQAHYICVRAADNSPEIAYDIPGSYDSLVCFGGTSLFPSIYNDANCPDYFSTTEAMKISIYATYTAAPTSPLTIQPSSKDTYLNKGDATTNYGSEETSWVGRAFSSDYIYRGLVEFAITWGTDIPAGATITSASLELYVYDVWGTAKTYYAQRLVRLDWVEAQATWNIYKTGSNWSTAGAEHSTNDYTATDQASTTNPAAYNWMTWNVLNQVKWAQTNNKNIAFRIVHSTEVTDDERISFTSKEFTGTAYRPKLVIGYTEAPANTAPTNGAGSITDMDDTDNLYAQRKWYTGSSVCSDADGFADIDYCEFRLKQGATTRAIFRYDEDTNTFSVESGSTEWDLDTSGSSATELGNDITITWKFKPQWDATQEDDLEIELYVVDDQPESDTDTAQTNYVDVITDLATTFSIDDDRGNVSQSITASGNITYSGSSLYPPDAEVTSVSVYDSANNNKGTDSTIVNGAWSVIFNAPATVGIETYNLYIDMADADYTDGEEATPTDTFITDRIEIVSVSFDDNRINVSGSAEVRYVLRYDYDDVSFTGTVGSIVGFTWDAGGPWWDKAITGQATVGTENYDENGLGAITDNNYGITAKEDDAGADIITDRIEVVSVAFDDSRINVSGSAEVRYQLRYDYDNVTFDDTKGTVTGFAWDGVNSWWDKAITGSSSVTSTNYDETDISFADTTYGLTAIEDDAGADVITDRITFLTNTLEVTDGRIDYNANGEWYAELKYEYDNTEVTDGSVTLNTGTMTWDGTDGRWEYTYSKGSVGTEIRNIASVSGNTHGITTLNSAVTSDSETIIFDRIEFVSVAASDTRINVGSNFGLRYQIRYDYDDVTFDNTKGSITGFSWDGTNNWWEKAITGSSNVVSTNYDETYISITDSTYGLTAQQDVAGVDVITERIRIDTIGVVDGRIDVNTQGTFYATASLEYDNYSLGTGDFLTLGGQAFTWSVANNRFEYSDTKATVQGLTINAFTSGNESTYGITAGNINSQTGTIIWDQVKIVSVAFDDNRINVGGSAEVRYVLRYDYDDVAFTGTDGSIVGFTWDVGNSWWDKSVTAPASPSAENYDENDITITDTTYGLTVKKDDAGADLIGDRITFLTNTLEVTDGRINYDATGEWYAELKYEYDNTEVTDGSVSLNTGSMTWDAGRGRWEYTYSKGSVGTEIRNIASVSGNAHGITALNSAVTSDSETIIFDRLEFISVAANDTRIDVGSTFELRYQIQYDYDDVTFDDNKGSITGFNWDTTNSWWDKSVTGSSSVTSTNYDETYLTITDSAHGLTVKQDVAGVDVITDRIKILTLSAVDPTIFVGTEGTWYATAELEHDNHSLGSGDSFTLSGYSFSWDTTDSRFEATGTKSTPQTVTINAYDSGLEATYGITAGNINALAQSVEWQVIAGGAAPILPPVSTTGSGNISESLGGQISQTFESGKMVKVVFPAKSIKGTIVAKIEPKNRTEVAKNNPLPKNTKIVGDLVADFKALSGGKELEKFEGVVPITFTYTDEQVKEAGVDEKILKIYWWDPEGKPPASYGASKTTGAWKSLKSEVNTLTNTITAYTIHLTLFAVMGEIITEKPAIEKPIGEMNVEEILTKMTEILTKLIQLYTQLIQLLKS